MAAKTNYYLLLGIFSFDDDLVGGSDDDPRVKKKIEDAKEAKKRQWADEVTKNPSKASRAGDSTDKLKYADGQLATCALRKAAWQDANARVEKLIDRHVGIFLSRGYVLEAEVQPIADRVAKDLKKEWDVDVQVPVDVVRRRIASRGVEIRKGEAGPAGRDLPKAKKNYAFTAQKNLPQYGYSSLYDLPSLYDLLGGKEKHVVDGVALGGRAVSQVKGTPTSQWRKWAEEDKSRLPTKPTTAVGDHKKIYALCAEVFKDDASRAQYDEYLRIESLRLILGEVEEACSVTKRLDPAAGEHFIERMLEASARWDESAEKPWMSRKDAAEYLLGHCAKKGIAYNPSGQDEASAPKLEFCPWCGAVVKQGVTACTACGGHIYTQCPNCQTKNRSDAKHCSQCGYSYDKLRQASSMAHEAKRLSGSLRFDDALRLLDEAEHLWNGLAEIASARKDVETHQKTFGPTFSKITAAVNDHRMEEAHRLYDELMHRAAGYSDPQLEEKINSGISTAKTIIESAGAKPAIGDLVRAYDACHDYPGIEKMFSLNPPQSVADLKATPDGERRRITLTWKPTQSENAISYLVIRKEGSRPLNSKDGETLARTAGTSFKDDTATLKPNTTYYYAVVSSIGPKESGLAIAGPVTVLFEVENVKLSADDSSIRITWSGTPAGADVEVWKDTDRSPAKPGDGTQVTNVIRGGLSDGNLENGTTYHYTIFVRYRDDDTDRAVYSSGVAVSGVPTAPPDPVSYLLPQLKEDGSFSIEWDQPENGDVQFYYSVGEPDVKEEDILAETELSGKGIRLDVASEEPGKGTFTLPDDDVYHIFAVTVMNGQAVIGAQSVVTKRKAVTIDKIQPSGASAFVMFEWPKDCTRVLLAWRSDRFPASPDDRKATRMSVNKQTYEMNHGIMVMGVDFEATYYFSLFAQLGSGDSASYSAPDNYRFGESDNRITYRVEARSFLGKVHSAKLVLTSNCPVPSCELRMQKRTIPVFKDDGVAVLAVSPQSGSGTMTFDIPASKIDKGMRYKLFFSDDRDYDVIDLALEPGASAEIGK